ncbi:hypothetical protein ACB098_04G083600 [Castanea mollissima]|uniref:Uncharacterized protein n=1 Tax=Castanea mollissima TaxID=60419 RepID=A0A8J4RPJ5_9ROSI|nr:hypothetical protein CMV_007125 [Castanea mollissima]
MALKLNSRIFSLILWLSLFLLFFHGMWLTFNTKNNRSIHNNQIPLSHHTTTTTLSNRKVLISKIDFSQFLQHQKKRHHVAAPPESAGTEIDPRYGAEKRLVPTGPNPLHH